MGFLTAMTLSDNVTNEKAPSISVKSLNYSFPDGSSGLKDVFLNLPPGSRTLLIGGIAYELVSSGLFIF